MELVKCKIQHDVNKLVAGFVRLVLCRCTVGFSSLDLETTAGKNTTYSSESEEKQ